MEIKKNKHANLERKKGNLFLFGLIVSAGSMLMAFEWINYDEYFTLPEIEIGELVEYEPAIEELIIEQPKPKVEIQKPIEEEFIIEEIPEEELPKDPVVKDEDNSEDDGLDFDSVPQFANNNLPTVEDIPISIAEVMPEYPGGMKSLYKDLAKKLSRNTTGMGGKVYVEFIVEKDGSISNVKIKEGLNEILDQQSVEAVKSLKNWTPGEQNYHKVRVKMVLPINYIIRS